MNDKNFNRATRLASKQSDILMEAARVLGTGDRLVTVVIIANEDASSVVTVVQAAPGVPESAVTTVLLRALPATLPEGRTATQRSLERTKHGPPRKSMKDRE